MIFPDVTPNMFHIDQTSISNFPSRERDRSSRWWDWMLSLTTKEWWPGFWTLWRIWGAIFSDFIG
jgi:hypothetical protein